MGASKATDSQAMALFLEANAQLAYGAVSPGLVWEGAQRTGLSLSALGNLAPRQVEELMWA